MSVFNTLKTTWLLDVPVKHVTATHLPDLLNQILSSRQFHHIVTANPEILLAAHRNPNYRTILQTAEACLADGFGLILMSWLIRPVIPARITGSHLVEVLLNSAWRHRHTIFILLPKDSLTPVSILESLLRKRYPGLVFQISFDRDDASALQADIVFSALGHPQQEFWIKTLRERGGRARIAVGVGGVFDFLTGSLRRAPPSIQASGLEWLWRLCLEPRRRWKRIIRATIIFPIITLYARIFFHHAPKGQRD